jgi:hypothetical protein
LSDFGREGQGSLVGVALKAELRRKITTEVAGRVDEAIEALGLDDLRVVQNHLIASRWIYNEIVSYLDNFFRVDRSNPRDFSIYPEFQSRTFRSLLIDLKSLEDKDGQNSLAGLLRKFDKLADLASLDEDPERSPERNGMVEAIKKTREFLKEISENPYLTFGGQ